jgi:hypothetical protein
MFEANIDYWASPHAIFITILCSRGHHIAWFGSSKLNSAWQIICMPRNQDIH